MPHIPGHLPMSMAAAQNRSAIMRGGLLKQYRPRLLSGQSLPNRTTMINAPFLGPDPSITNVTGSFASRNGAPQGRPTFSGAVQSQPNVIRQPGGISSAISKLRDAVPMQTFDSPTTPQLAQEQGVPSEATEGPEGFLGKIGGFFKRPGMQQALLSAGAAMMSGRDAQGNAYTDALQGVGAGLSAGLNTYQAVKEDQRIQEDRDRETAKREGLESALALSITGREGEEPLSEADAQIAQSLGGQEGLDFVRTVRQQGGYREALAALTVGMDGAEYKALEALATVNPEDAFTQAQDYVNSDRAKAARVQLLIEQNGYTPEAAEIAAADPQATLAAIQKGAGYQVMPAGDGRLTIIRNGKVIRTRIGDPRISEQLANAEESQNWDATASWRESHEDQYAALNEQVSGIPEMVQTLEEINDQSIRDYFNKFGNFKQHIAELLQLEETEQIQKVDQMLDAFGIQNLSLFKGAISEMELLLALQNAGDITLTRGMLNEMFNRKISNIINDVRKHNESGAALDARFANMPAVVGQDGRGIWSNPDAFGFDLGEEGTYNPETGELEGGSGLLGFQKRGDAAAGGFIDQAINEVRQEQIIEADADDIDTGSSTLSPREQGRRVGQRSLIIN